MRNPHLPAGSLANPPAPDLLTFGQWYARSGGSGSAAEYRSSYLTDEYGDTPFGRLPVDDALPASLHRYPISRAVVADIAGRMIEFCEWSEWLESCQFSEGNTPPAGAPEPDDCLAYFNQALTIRYRLGGLHRAASYHEADLTASALLRGVSLALPLWPGHLHGSDQLTEPQAAIDAMQTLLTGGLLPEAVEADAHLTERCARLKFMEWSGLVLLYALNLDPLE